MLQDIGSKYGVNGARIYSVSPIHPFVIRAASCTARNTDWLGLAQLLLLEAGAAEIDCRRQLNSNDGSERNRNGMRVQDVGNLKSRG